MLQTLLDWGADPLQDMGNGMSPLSLMLVDGHDLIDIVFAFVSSSLVVERIVALSSSNQIHSEVAEAQ